MLAKRFQLQVLSELLHSHKSQVMTAPNVRIQTLWCLTMSHIKVNVFVCWSKSEVNEIKSSSIMSTGEHKYSCHIKCDILTYKREVPRSVRFLLYAKKLLTFISVFTSIHVFVYNIRLHWLIAVVPEYIK